MNGSRPTPWWLADMRAISRACIASKAIRKKVEKIKSAFLLFGHVGFVDCGSVVPSGTCLPLGSESSISSPRERPEPETKRMTRRVAVKAIKSQAPSGIRIVSSKHVERTDRLSM